MLSSVVILQQNEGISVFPQRDIYCAQTPCNSVRNDHKMTAVSKKSTSNACNVRVGKVIPEAHRRAGVIAVIPLITIEFDVIILICT